MHDFRSRSIADLASQLKRGPARLRLRQLLNTEFLLSVVEPDKAYPADFVCHVLTGARLSAARPDSRDGELIDGDVLIGDLVVLAEQLSEDARITIEHWGGTLYSISDLAKRFDVSTKTIFRWRRRGLVGWKFRFPDRRMRLAFPDRCVRRFVAQHVELVQRGRSFSQLTQAERLQILARAGEAVRHGHATINSVARQLAAETGRAIETIRLILKAHEAAHPEGGVFSRALPDGTLDAHAVAIWEAYRDGARLEALAERFGQPPASIYRTLTRMRARELRACKIEYIPSPAFHSPNADDEILNDPHVRHPWKLEPPGRHVPADLPPYLQQLFQIPLLTREGEAALFRKMNYLKSKADSLRRTLDPDTVSAAELDQIEALLEEAGRVKNQITQANLRLVVSVAKRHVGPGLDFFEIVSDGNLSLMRAVDKFDYARGFKFSTYASWAIMRNYARMIPEQRYHRDRYQTGRDELLENIVEPVLEEPDTDQLAVVRGALERMLCSLDDRERSILRQRFGLEEQGQPQTLEQIGRRFGVSKERVRQLESRAINKLRHGFEAEVRTLLGT